MSKLSKQIAPKTVLSPLEKNLANTLVKQQIAAVRSSIVDSLSSMAISDITITYFIKYTNEQPCSWCFQVKEIISFSLFGKKSNLNKIFEKRCFRNDGTNSSISKEIFKSWGINECPCEKGENNE
ncbi:hypothetical protein [uncultured Fibrobacter sp.]|uniref:hypothetical protein n=1 Tax=uncultured Fibrobacter sp. TaxID=261512 RepID=UPI0028043679|nr:hypothetical protein [uncultured Fibrobacter sp.]